HTVQGRINIYYGTDKDLKGKTTAADLTAEMLLRGTTKRGYQELRDELDRLKASVEISNQGPGQALVSVTTTRENFADVLALIAEVLQRPAFAADQFGLITGEHVTSLESQLQDPQAQAITALQRTFKPYPRGDVRYVPTIQEEIALIKKTKLAEVKKLHQQLWGASHATASFVGDFDTEELKGALETHFGAWKSKKPFKRIPSTYVKNDPAPQVIQTPDKKMAIILAAKTLSVRDDNPEYAGLVIAGYVLGGGASSRLLTRLRHSGGLSYGAFGGIQASSLDEVGALFGGAILAPENVDKGMAALLDEIEKLIAKGIPDKELEDAKAAYIKQTQTQLASDDFVATALANNLYLGRTMEFSKQLEARIQQLTSADIARALNAHVSAEGLTHISAGDLPK
ncbi:MAG TPA: pitrilysin family protein, partial [Kofleriaceae bacterium]|nr:pitrilysin family protein [Kofleriaceae bacterium]